MGQSLVSTWLVLGKVRALLLLEEFLVQMVRCLASNSGLAQSSVLMLAPVEWVEVVGGIVSGVAEMVYFLVVVSDEDTVGVVTAEFEAAAIGESVVGGASDIVEHAEWLEVAEPVVTEVGGPAVGV